MSGRSAPGEKPGKTMSSRLLTMKFMQRAAAAASPSSNLSAVTTPSSSTKRPPHSENDYDEDTARTPPSQKRQKFSSSTHSLSEASSPVPTPRSADLDAITVAKAAEDQKRSAAVAKYAAEAGETQWVLNFGPAAGVHNERTGARTPGYPYIVSAQSLDSMDQSHHGQDDDSETLSGRQSYGNYKRKNKSQAQSADDRDEYGGRPDDGDEIVNPHCDNMADSAHVDAVMRRAQHNADRKRGMSKGQGKRGAPGEVNLRNLTSISGGGGSGSGGGGGPNSSRKRGRDDRRR